MKKGIIMAAALVFVPALFGSGLSAQTIYSNEEMHKAAPEVPEYMVFAGDTVRFDRQDFYERMDRELISFTYMHTNSTLLLKRSNRLFAQLEPLLEKYGLPDDFKYLVAIESNLDPKAVSSAGAAGYWQLMKSSAQELGLEVNGEVDERYDLEKATQAAAKYLLRAYEKYGNWITAAASYNCGQNGMSRRLAAQHTSNALELWMSEETSRYVYRILAAKMLLNRPQDFGFNVPVGQRYQYIPPRTTVSVSSAIPNLVDFAEKHGTTYKRLKEANLWLRSDKLTNARGKLYKIAIP